MNTKNQNQYLKKPKIKIQRRMFQFKNGENLIKCVTRLYEMQKSQIETCEIYKYKKCYRMIIKSTKNCIANICAIEFSENYTDCPLEISKTEEYGYLLIENQAIESLGKIFSPKT